MLQNIKIYAITFVIFFIIDIAWLALVAKNFYNSQIGFLMKSNVNWTAAICFYLLFIAALVFFIINPALAKNSIKYALFAGAFFGLITYATYDLTNLATLKDWPLKLTIIDLVWGTSLSALTSSISFTIIKYILK